MLGIKAVKNKKPQREVGTQPQGKVKVNESNGNFTILKDSKSRYEKGMGLYKSGRVSIGPNGLFKVSGFQVNTERMQCECPDYRTRKEPCKHLFAAILFVKNSGKDKIGYLEGFNGNGNGSHKDIKSVKEPAPKSQEAHSKDFDRQTTITRLAVINSAIELLKTHRKPIELTDVVFIASQLEKWALGNWSTEKAE